MVRRILLLRKTSLLLLLVVNLFTFGCSEDRVTPRHCDYYVFEYSKGFWDFDEKMVVKIKEKVCLCDCPEKVENDNKQ